MLGQRIKVYGAFALLGFFVGAIAYIAYFKAWPLLLNIYPQIAKTGWLLWGFVGALITVIGCLIYALMPERF